MFSYNLITYKKVTCFHTHVIIFILRDFFIPFLCVFIESTKRLIKSLYVFALIMSARTTRALTRLKSISKDFTDELEETAV